MDDIILDENLRVLRVSIENHQRILEKQIEINTHHREMINNLQAQIKILESTIQSIRTKIERLDGAKGRFEQ